MARRRKEERRRVVTRMTKRSRVILIRMVTSSTLNKTIGF